MASRCNLNPSQIPWLCRLVLVWTVICFSEAADMISLSGEIGGNVTFPCPVDKGKTVNFFYFQRGNMFVNGYHANKDIPVQPWENTRLDRSETAVHMYGLNISHIGVYQCHLQYSDDSKTATTEISLTVTARYSKPTITTAYVEENHSRLCVVTCASHGGYPQTDMRFEVNVSGNSSRQMWNVVNSSHSKDPDTMMHNSSSTASFNCSHGELHHIRCSVGEATSDLFSVCEPQPPPPTPNNLALIIAVVAVCSVVAVMTAVFLWRRHCKHKNRPSELKANGHAEEVLLKDVPATNVS